MKLAQNGPPSTYPFLPAISFTNSGLGALSVTGVSGSGSGVSAYDYQGLAIVAADPTGLSPGTYSDGAVTVACNAANCPLEIPVTVQVEPTAPPTIQFQGAVDNAAFSPSGAPLDVMVVKGDQLSSQSYQAAAGAPLPTSLGGASVLVNGVATPIYYSSAGQIAFQLRQGTALGTAFVQVLRDGQTSNTVSMNVAQYAPGAVVITDTSYNVVDATHPVKAGSTLVFWAIGLGPTIPNVPEGVAAPASPLAQVLPTVYAVFGTPFFTSTNAATFAGLSPGSVGLYQVIATLPSTTPSGTVTASLLMPGAYTSNKITIGVQ